MKKAILLVINLVLLAGLSSGCTYSGDGPQLVLNEPDSTRIETDEPEINIRLFCKNIDELRLNDRRMTEHDKELVCGIRGDDFELDEGENIFDFVGIQDPEGERFKYRLKLYIDYEPE